ncbi:hypothetical protein Y032_0090g2379 [Ancylostoma ceylanicum]|uniref:Uncharacterized protein n=1 Tax=Ancylostoma ceylanicum TaxID=53326 RepID=A0A016TM61_9BILA|nr:hypothetical protein Y032_0090g2379 [Ancylostoma ceylanicum]
MFISFLAGDSIIIGVDSNGAVGKAADSQYQNHVVGRKPPHKRALEHPSLWIRRITTFLILTVCTSSQCCVYVPMIFPGTATDAPSS